LITTTQVECCDADQYEWQALKVMMVDSRDHSEHKEVQVSLDLVNCANLLFFGLIAMIRLPR
jgi:hypothetical protein